MNASELTVRRATVDDLNGLKQLWERTRLQVLDLERRLTEFQLLVSNESDLLGAIGLHIEGKQGQLHSEAFTQPEQEDRFRAQLWERLQIVARNHGLVRLWTQERSPFWQQAGFGGASPELLKKLPSGFGDAQAYWLALQLKEENLAAFSLEQEFELFQAAQKEESERLRRLGRSLKNIVMALVGIILAIGLFFVARVLLRNPSFLTPGGH